MRSSKCGTEGIPGEKFCAECGSPLSNRCSNCNSDDAPGVNFCADCGSALNKDVAAEGGKPSAAEAAGGVRAASERTGATSMCQRSDARKWRRELLLKLSADSAPASRNLVAIAWVQ